MMALMVAANITVVFIGIETPNEESLRETKKFQNVRGGTIVDRVRKVQDSGLEVWCGMIVGFDHDDTRIFKEQLDFIQQTDIMHAMVGMLSAIPRPRCTPGCGARAGWISPTSSRSART